MLLTIKDLGREETLLNGISLGLEHKFGKEGLGLYPEITRLNNIELLFAIQKGLWTMNSLSELRSL